ncbi:uncharacterized protein P884DRAFT_285887 [Thermothelomyces heterothallicus CBS 202.75]|uniref:uncharacterized protein n=1 Tax=Thermothelomyces heterothallicus CBS 202.75 TaxID=1149848 RepID=UPI003742E83C
MNTTKLMDRLGTGEWRLLHNDICVGELLDPVSASNGFRLPSFHKSCKRPLVALHTPLLLLLLLLLSLKWVQPSAFERGKEKEKKKKRGGER